MLGTSHCRVLRSRAWDLLKVRERQQHVVGRVRLDFPHTGGAVMPRALRGFPDRSRRVGDDAATVGFV